MADGEQRTVLIAYDGSDQAKGAIREAGRVLGPGPRAIVLTVREPLETFVFSGIGGGGTLDPATVSAMQESAQNEATVVVEEGAKSAAEAGFAAEPRVEVAASPWQAIVAVGDELDADVIVMGSRGRGRVTAAVLGSVSNHVMHEAAVPVIVIHRPSGGPDMAA
jgi:nucleotide-binding universal stress UspA family protein